MIPIAKPELGEAEIALVAETIRSGWITQGPRVAEFEETFAKRMGASHAVAVSNCTAALHISLLVAGVGPGDEVLVSPHSFIASANAILHSGARPVFVDIDPLTLNMDEGAAVEAVTSRTKAILAIHQVGRPSDLSLLSKLARERGLTLIEDAACAAGSAYKGRPIGDNTHSQLVCFSFHPRKIISTGDGGMITTGDSEIARRLRLLRQHGMSVNDLERHKSKTIVSESYPTLGYNYRLTDVQASIGLGQLRQLDSIVSRRRSIAARYDAAFADMQGVAIFLEPKDARWNHQTYLIRLDGSTADTRDAFMQRLLDRGIATRRGIMSIHREAHYVERYGRLSYPKSEMASDQCVCLPLFTQMTESEISAVIDGVRKERPGLAR